MISFGIFGMFVMYKANPFFLSLIAKIPHLSLYIISIILFLLILIDSVVSFKIINNIKNINKETQRKQLIKKDDTERITKLVKKQIYKSKRKFHQRIIKAFPHLQMQKWKNTKK